MRLIKNIGGDRVVDNIRTAIKSKSRVDLLTSDLSVFAFGEVVKALRCVTDIRLILPPVDAELNLLGGPADRARRNQLQNAWLAAEFRRWILAKASIRYAPGSVPQGAFVVRDADGRPLEALMGSLSLTVSGLGITPDNAMALVQASETPQEAVTIGEWFDSHWATLDSLHGNSPLLSVLEWLSAHKNALSVYAFMLHRLFEAETNGFDEHAIVNSATGIRDTKVWRKLYRFQRDGVVGAIDKLNRFGGCIIADSVGLGKTFEALAIIKYHELRNDRVLVLCPKRLRDNWTIYTANDRRNILATDRFNYDVLNHTDLSTGVSITDLTLTDFRIDLAQYQKEHKDLLESMPQGSFAVLTTTEADIPPGIIFCLQAAGAAIKQIVEPGYPLDTHFLVHVGEDGEVVLSYTQAKRILDRLKRLCVGRDMPDAAACKRFDQMTRQGADMRYAQGLLASSIASVAGKSEERAVSSLFKPGGTHALKGEFAGMDDFEVAAFVVVLPDEQEGAKKVVLDGLLRRAL